MENICSHVYVSTLVKSSCTRRDTAPLHSREHAGCGVTETLCQHQSKESCRKRSGTSTQVLPAPSFKVPFDPGRAKTGDTSHLQRLNSINCNSANYVDQEAMPTMLAPPVKDNTFLKCGQGLKCSHRLTRWNWRSNIITCKAAPTSYRAQRPWVTVAVSNWVGVVPHLLLGGSRSAALNYSISWREIKINISIACPEWLTYLPPV